MYNVMGGRKFPGSIPNPVRNKKNSKKLIYISKTYETLILFQICPRCATPIEKVAAARWKPTFTTSATKSLSSRSPHIGAIGVVRRRSPVAYRCKTGPPHRRTAILKRAKTAEALWKKSIPYIAKNETRCSTK